MLKQAPSVAELALKMFRPPPVWETIGWDPQPKQSLAEDLCAEADELLFGGAAGGGKSEWLLHHAIAECLRYANNRWIIFRRTMPSLELSLIPRANAVLTRRDVPLAKWNGQTYTWTFPNGSTLVFGHLTLDETTTRYQGAEFGGVGFEEITEFTEYQWEYLITRLRAPADGIRSHAIATTNPGGIGHAWVKRRWIKPKPEDLPEQYRNIGLQPYQVWQPIPSDEMPHPLTRVFVPSLLEDNPALLKRDPNYRAKLQGLATSTGMRLALERGDWDAIEKVPGALWNMSNLDANRVATAPGLARVIVGVDPSGGKEKRNDAQGIVVAGRGYNGHGYTLADRTCSLSPEGWAKRAVAAYHEFQADKIVAEVNYGGEMVISTIKQVDSSVPVEAISASRGKRQRAEPVSAIFSQNKAHQVGNFDDMELECTTWVPESGHSPNRMDALVWAYTDLFGLALATDYLRQLVPLCDACGAPLIEGLICPDCSEQDPDAHTP